MKNILVIGATGQIGSELTLELRKRYGDDHVVAGYIPSAMPQGELKASGPSAIADVTDRQSIEVVARQFKIDTIYNLAALLSVVAESRPAMAWKIGIDGLWNVLEVAREYGCAVFTPSSIGSFGENTPHVKTPQDTIQRPRTMYGVTKVTTELLSDYYYTKYGVDTRAVRFPGIISNVTPPGWRYDGLCGRHLLLGRERREVRMSRKGGYIYGHDVYARCHQCGYLADGSRSGAPETPECVQHRFHELRPGNDLRRYQEACARL